MAVLSSPGVGSGLDISGLVSSLMAVEQQPLTILNKKETSFQAKLSAYGTLKGALATLQSAAQTLASTSTFNGMSAAVSDTTVYTASATSDAAAGSYDITVSKLAKANQIHTNVDYGTDIFDSGTLRITIGAGTATESTTDIVTTSNNTLTGIRDAINGGSAGVTATIVNDGTADRLVLTSSTTGAAGAITLAAPASGNDGTRRLTDLIGANLSTDQPAQDAEFTVNNLSIKRSSNVVTDVIDGVTLNLLKADATTPTEAKLTLSKNTSAIPTALKSFVDAYNTAVGQIKSFTAYDATNKKASVLTGDSTARSIQSQLIAAIGGAVTGVDGGISTLSDIGVSVQKDGTMALNSSKLSTVLSDSSKDIATLFTSTDSSNPGIAVRFNTTLESLIGTGGLLASRSDGITGSIRTISTRRDALNVRLASIEARYRRQFNALDSLVAGMQSTQTYLTQQLAQISSITSQSN